MAEPTIIVDAGPLVAFTADDDEHHVWAVERFRSLRPPFLTSEPVLVEVFHLLWRRPQGRQSFFRIFESDVVVTGLALMVEREPLAKLLRKYEDLPMSLADASLVRLSELYPHATVLTLDSHFRIYRKNGRRQIPLLMPP